MSLPDVARALAILERAGIDTAAAEPLGHGCDFWAIAIGSALYRVAKNPGSVDFEREARLLDAIAPHLPCEVPRLLERGDGFARYRLIEGNLGSEVAPSAELAGDVGAFLAALHAIADAPSELRMDKNPMERIHTRAVADVEIALAAIDPRHHASILRYVASPPPDVDTRVLTHADLALDHVLVRDGRLAAVIDWTDARVSDPALDLGFAWPWGAPEFCTSVFAVYGALRDPGLFERARFAAVAAALHDTRVALEVGRVDWIEHAHRTFACAAALDAR